METDSDGVHAPAGKGSIKGMPHTRSLHLYRAILREVRTLDSAPLRRKITRNTRELFQYYRTAGGPLVQELHQDGQAVITIARWLQSLPEVGLQPARGTGAVGRRARARTCHLLFGLVPPALQDICSKLRVYLFRLL